MRDLFDTLLLYSIGVNSGKLMTICSRNDESKKANDEIKRAGSWETLIPIQIISLFVMRMSLQRTITCVSFCLLWFYLLCVHWVYLLSTTMIYPPRDYADCTKSMYKVELNHSQKGILTTKSFCQLTTLTWGAAQLGKVIALLNFELMSVLIIQ